MASLGHTHAVARVYGVRLTGQHHRPIDHGSHVDVMLSEVLDAGDPRNHFGGLDALVGEDVPRPTPGNGEVLRRVKAAGVGPWDAWISVSEPDQQKAVQRGVRAVSSLVDVSSRRLEEIAALIEAGELTTRVGDRAATRAGANRSRNARGKATQARKDRSSWRCILIGPRQKCSGRRMNGVAISRRSQMETQIAKNGKEVAHFGVPWEKTYGYSQAVRVGNTIYLAGQLSHDDNGDFIGPATLDGSGRPIDTSNVELQMRTTYANAAKVLASFGAGLEHVVEEVLYVIDMDSAFAVAGPVRKAAYGTDSPQCVSTIVQVTRLALPQQLIEVSFTAVLPN